MQPGKQVLSTAFLQLRLVTSTLVSMAPSSHSRQQEPRLRAGGCDQLHFPPELLRPGSRWHSNGGAEATQGALKHVRDEQIPAGWLSGCLTSP